MITFPGSVKYAGMLLPKLTCDQMCALSNSCKNAGNLIDLGFYFLFSLQTQDSHEPAYHNSLHFIQNNKHTT